MPLIFCLLKFFSKLLRWTLCLKPFVLTFCFHLTVWKIFNFRFVCFAFVFSVLFSLSIASILRTPSSQEIILVLYCPYVCVAALTARLVKAAHVTCTRIAGAGSLVSWSPAPSPTWTWTLPPWVKSRRRSSELACCDLRRLRFCQ